MWIPVNWELLWGPSTAFRSAIKHPSHHTVATFCACWTKPCESMISPSQIACRDAFEREPYLPAHIWKKQNLNCNSIRRLDFRRAHFVPIWPFAQAHVQNFNHCEDLSGERAGWKGRMPVHCIICQSHCWPKFSMHGHLADPNDCNLAPKDWVTTTENGSGFF